MTTRRNPKTLFFGRYSWLAYGLAYLVVIVLMTLGLAYVREALYSLPHWL